VENNSSNQNRSWEDNNYSNQGFDSTSNQQQNQGQQNWSSQPYRSKLPADNSSMVLAIIATVLFVICCCFGGPFIALILSIIGFVLAHNSVNRYQQNPEQYSPESFRRVKNAKTYNLVIGIISILIVILSFLDLFDNSFKIGDRNFDIIDLIENDESYEDDSYHEETEDDWYEYEEEVDSLDQEIESIEETVIEETLED